MYACRAKSLTPNKVLCFRGSKVGPRPSSGEPVGTQAPAPSSPLRVTPGSPATKSFLCGTQRVICVGFDSSPTRTVTSLLVAGVMKRKRRVVDYL